MRRLNLVFLAMLLVVVAVMGGGLQVLHGFQVRRNASALLDRARRAESGGDLEKAEQLLDQYLNLEREDGPTWEWYARIVDERSAEGRRRERVFLIHEEALRHQSSSVKLERRCADLALELGRYSEAQRHFASLLEQLAADSQGQADAVWRSDLEDLLGQCDRGLARFDEAEKSFLRALQHDPERVSCYDRLARLRRINLRRNESADGTIQEMVAKNPKSGLAYVYRWRYFQEFSPPADAKDIGKALTLAPDDPEVLLTAAVASEQQPDAATARAYYEKGCEVDPKNLALVLGLARLETRERHLDRAEAILRRGVQARPVVALVFALAETLILRDKIEGKEQAEDYIARLGKAGLSETLGRFLETEILFQRKKWAEAIPRIEMARVVLKADPRLTIQLDLMLAECYGRIGHEEQRLDALRRAAEGDNGPDAARIDLAQSLARSGKLDEAVTILLPMAERKPEWRLDLVRLLLQRAIRAPRDQRDWDGVERSLRQAESAIPQAVEPLALLRLDVLAAQGRLEDARLFLSRARTKDPRNLQFRLAQAKLAQRQGGGALALSILDQAEKDLGNSLDLQLARLDYWGLEGGATAMSAVAKLAEARQQIPVALRPAFLDRLGSAEIRLGALSLGKEHWRELAALQPGNLAVRLGLLELTLAAGDHDAAGGLVDEIRKAEGDEGTNWRFARAALLIESVRRGASKDLDAARRLASEIAQRRPQWEGSFVLDGEIAELAGSVDEAIGCYRHAVELGNVQPRLVRRLVSLLNERSQFTEIDRLAQMLRDQGAALDEITIVRALDAIRKQEFDRGIALARQVFRQASQNYSDHLMLGRIYRTAARSDEAGSEFRRAVDLSPGVPESWLTYIQHLVQTGQLGKAKTAVEAARGALPADSRTVTLAECSLMVGDLKQAETLIHTVLKEKPRDPTSLRIAADLYLALNRLDTVNEYLDKLQQVAGVSTGERAWGNRTRIALLLRTGRLADRDEALTLVDRNLRNNPDSIEDLGLKAAILAQRSDRRGEAIKVLERPAVADRLEAKERFLLAQLYLSERNEQKYMSEMLKLVNQKVRNPQHLVHFITYWIGRNQLDQADRWLSELKQAEPEGQLALQLEARLLDIRKRKPELLTLLETRGREVPDQIGQVADLLDHYGFAQQAEAAFKAFIAVDTTKPERALALARFMAHHDRVAEAMELLKKAWSTCAPEQVVAAALSLYDAPSAGEAERRQVETWLADAIGKRPELVLLASKLGVIRIRQGRFDEAERLFRQGLASDPDNLDVLNNLAWLLALQSPSKAQEALGLIDRAIGIQGPTTSLLDTRAVVLIRAGKPARAVQDLTEVQKLDPQKPSSVQHLAWAYQSLGQRAEAKLAFQKAGELGWRMANTDPLERAFMEKLQRDLNRAEN
jgi:cellulose synthase operon protein C